MLNACFTYLRSTKTLKRLVTLKPVPAFNYTTVKFEVIIIVNLTKDDDESALKSSPVKPNVKFTNPIKGGHGTVFAKARKRKFRNPGLNSYG